MDGSGIPVPETPMNGPNDDSGLELIGQELVIHRTIHQSTGQTPTAALPIESLVTPTRPTTRSVTSALAENSNQGGLDGNGGSASEMQMVRTYPRGTPMSSEMQRMPYPKGSPIAYGPSSSVGDQSQQLPLFTQDQLRRLHDLQSQAPQFYDERIARPSFLQTEENRLGSSGVVGFPQFPMTPEVRDELKRQEESMKNQVDLLRQQVQQLAQQNQPLREINKTLKEENELLKLRLSLFDVAPGTPVFATPNPSTEKEHGRMGPETNFTVGFEVPKNDKATENDLVTENEAVTQNAEAFENAPAFEYAHVPESFKAFEYQEKNLLEGDEALKNVQGKRSHYNTEETYGNNHGGGRADPSSSSSGDQSRQNGEMLHLMAKMMEGMSSLQKQILDGKDHESENVRSNLELPKLPEWTSTSGPVDLSDWLCVIEPLMADLSNSSSEWWTKLSKEAQVWYEEHLRLQPLDRVSHEPKPSAQLSQQKWVRLERRASSMLLMSVPQSLREELVSTKRVSALSIICHLMTLYQPGGLGEKELILKQLEAPQEPSSLAESLQGLRKWTRWRRRAMDLGVQEPDPFLLLKGLNRLTKKILEQHRDLSFRISLARSTLQVDNTPTSRSVTSFALHLIAEIEQVVYHEAQPSTKKGPLPNVRTVRSKKFEAEEDKGKGKGRDVDGVVNDSVKCKYYLTQGGCKKGRDCRFSHDQKDDLRRCYICGSSEHLVPGCPRRRSDQSSRSTPPKAAKAEAVEEQEKDEPVPPSSSTTEDRSQEPTVKGLLEEATKVLKSISSTNSTTTKPKASASDNQRDQLMDNLQRQLDQLRSSQSTSLKVLRLSRLAKGTLMGLIDSGATHALRPLQPLEDKSEMSPVEVTLADGNKKRLMMTKEGTMITDSPEVEPIIPMGILTAKLGCEVVWSGDQVTIRHPTRGEIDVTCVDGCPMIRRSLALELIEEAEKVGMRAAFCNLSVEREQLWLQQLVDSHPILRQLPEHVKESLTTGIGEWKDLPVNKRLRKRFRRDGFTVHLFAGKDEGQTLKKTFQQMGGNSENLLELDILRDQRHDFLTGGGVYGSLLRAAMDNKLLALLGGPNCRTRSVLRHKPIEGKEDYPKPVRSWMENQIYGLLRLGEEDRKKVEDDDVMLWRMVFLFMVATYVNKASCNPKPLIGFLLEQPASPREYEPECVSLWDQEDWKGISQEFDLQECTVNQSDFGGSATKPTTFANNLDLQPSLESRRPRGKIQVNNSKMLSRWAPGVMHMISLALKSKVYNEMGHLRAMSWKEHVDHQHYPFRRDCKICQESLQRDLPHRKVKHPLCGVLSADTSGPFHLAPDVVGKAKYMLVSTLTWLVPKKSPLKEPEDSSDPVPPEAPIIECDQDEEEEETTQPPGDPLDLFDEEAEKESQGHPTGALGNVEDATRDSGEDGEMALEEGSPEELQEGFEIRTFRMTSPMSSKASGEVTRAVLEVYLRLKADGFVISRFHTDRGREFSNQLRKWFTTRGIVCTRTAGDNPQSNGRSEVAVQNIKSMLRRALLQAGAGPENWPWALRHINERLREHRLEKKVSFPNFLQKVLVNKRTWKNRQFESVKEEVSYLCPAWFDHGHWVKKEGESPMVTRCVLQKLDTPPTTTHWIALERESADQIAVRRRIRGKTTIKAVRQEEEEEAQEGSWERQRSRILKVVEEEMMHLVNDDPEIAIAGVQTLTKLRKLASSESEEEEVLQTRIISPKEVNQQWSEWLAPAADEVKSMLEEKKALKPVTREELQGIKRKAEKENKRVELIPSKLVYTKKPAPPPKRHKNKVRWVVCGNYETKHDDEEVYSGGADAASFRIMAHFASRKRWQGASVDIRTAFLNADMDQQGSGDLVFVKPPYQLVEKGLLQADVVFEPMKAVYGFRRSPRLWGLCRDETLMKMKLGVELNGKKTQLILQPLESEPNLWMIREQQGDLEEESAIHGMLMTYVDDIFIVGEIPVVKETLKIIQETWTTSPPKAVTESPIKFLGMEVSKYYNENLKKEVWRVTQESYLKDLLEKEPQLKVRMIPITRDQAAWSAPVVEPTAPLVKQAQSEVGSLLWLVTRTRPDIMFAVSKLSSLVTRDPTKALEIASQIKGYLKGTAYDGLEFAASSEEEDVVNAFSDASFAPEGDYSHGCAIVMLQQSPVLWKSGKQPVATLSTAESELLEVVETMTMGESIHVVVNEINPGTSRVAWCDSQAAVSILSNEGGSWRTRHLRVRSSYARATIKQGNWLLHHLAGAQMVADIGTKVLTAARMEFLKNLLGMKGGFERGIQKLKEKKEDEVSGGIDPNLIIQAVRVLAIAALLDSADATREVQKNETKGQKEDIDTEEELWWFLYVYTILIVLSTMFVGKLIRWFEPQILGGFEVMKGWLGRGSPPVTPTSSDSTSTSTPESFQDLPLSHDQGQGSRGDLQNERKVPQVQRPSGLPQSDGLRDKGCEPVTSPSSPKWKGQESNRKSGNLSVPREAPTSSSSTMMINIGGINLELGDRMQDFRPIVTRWGSVYHTDPKCKYLLARSTGKHFEAQLCDQCLSVIRDQGRRHPQKGDILNGNPQSITARGTMIYHLDNCCNTRGPFQALTLCTVCSKK